VRALKHALEAKRLHHAYLFTGTAGGVGRPPFSAHFGEVLNCETGVNPRPCGKCSACIEIDAGRSSLSWKSMPRPTRASTRCASF